LCEYCGCQALASIEALTREHEQVLTLISDVRSARRVGDLARQADLACRIAAVLRPHTFVEERGLFPALAADFPDQIALLEAEHRLIEASLAEAAHAARDGALPADPAWSDRLTRALELLREHIFKEQDGVFPAALATLRTADWEAADAARLAAAGIAAAAGDSASGEG
jgi:hemerythrin-like domain-containing protein